MIEQKKQILLTRLNSDIQKFLKQLGTEGQTPEQAAEIEQNIEQTKAKIRELLGQKAPAANKTEYKKRIEATTRTVEMHVSEINPSLRSVTAMLKSLGVVGKVSDFKFTTEDKSKAFVKLLVDVSNEEITTRLEATNLFTFSIVIPQA